MLDLNSGRRAPSLIGVLGIVAILLTVGASAASGAFLDVSPGGKRTTLGNGGSEGPSKPGRPDIIAVTGSAVTISWRKSNARTLAGYRVYRDDVFVASTSTSETRYTFAGLRCGTSYRLGIEAYDRAGRASANVAILGATAACVDATPPTAPSGVSQVGVTSSSITLSWNGSSDDFGVVAYEVLRDGDVAGTTATTFFSVSSLACATMYTVGIRALDAAGNRSPAASVLMTTAACPDVTAPSTPVSLAVTSVNETSVSITWTEASDDFGVLGYGVYRGGETVGSTRVTSYVVSGLDCGTSYVVAVDAYDGAGNRSGRSSLTAATSPCPDPPGDPGEDTTPPTVPAALRVTGATAQSISLAWRASFDDVGVVGYGLYRDASGAGSASLPSGTFAGLACGRSYALEIDAYDAAGNRSARTAVVASTSPCPDTEPPSAPVGLTQTAASETTIALGWAASTDDVGVAGYGIYVGGVRVGSVASPGYTFAALTCGTTYSVAVDAYDAAGSRSEATTLAVTTRSCADTQAPSAPQDQWVGDATLTSMAMSWSASTDNVGVAGYAVHLDGARVATTTTTAYTYTGLECGRTYTVGLEAFDAAGNASARAQASRPASTAPCLPHGDTSAPSSPTGVATSSQTQTAITLSWNASTDNVGVAGYGYYRNGSLVGSGTGTSYSFGGLTCGTGYTLAVEAYDVAGNRSERAGVSTFTSSCSPPPSSGASVFVTPTGSDASPCTQAAPCRSFDRAYRVANPGQVVEVAGGTYPGQGVHADGAKTSSSDVVFRPAAGAQVTISGWVGTEGADHVTFEGMRTTGYYIDPGSDDVTFLNMRTGIFTIVGGRNITIRGGEVGPWTTSAQGEDPQIGASGAGEPPVNITIDGVYFHDIQRGSPADHTECLQFGAGQNVVIRNSRFVRCSDHNIFIRSWGRFEGDKVANFTVENNFFGPPTLGYYTGQFSHAVDSRSCDYFVLRNNTLTKPWSVGCSAGTSSPAAVQIYGNLWAFTFDAAMCANRSVWSYNYFESGSGTKCSPTDSFGDGDANFVDRLNQDYHLAPESDARGKADPNRYPITDIDRDSRSIAAGAPDAGADEVG